METIVNKLVSILVTSWRCDGWLSDHQNPDELFSRSAER